jgi:hypothetical protein
MIAAKASQLFGNKNMRKGKYPRVITTEESPNHLRKLSILFTTPAVSHAEWAWSITHYLST